MNLQVHDRSRAWPVQMERSEELQGLHDAQQSTEGSQGCREDQGTDEEVRFHDGVQEGV